MTSIDNFIQNYFSSVIYLSITILVKAYFWKIHYFMIYWWVEDNRWWIMIISSSLDCIYSLIVRFRVDIVSQEIDKAYEHILEDLLQSEEQEACNRYLLWVYPFFSFLHFLFCQESAIVDLIFWSRCPAYFSIVDLW